MTSRYIGVVAVAMAITACSGGSDNPPLNRAPAVLAVADQSISANQPSAPIGFTISDEDPANVSVVVESDRQDLLPDSALVLGGSGADRTLSITPIADLVGDAQITITVTDTDGASTSTFFAVTVDPEQLSLQQFVRDTFAQSGNSEPRLINAVEFTQDADNDDFNDLLQP